MQLIFKAYATDEIDLAVKLFKKKTGEEPAVIMIRPEKQIVGKHSALVRSPLGASNLILVSHLVTKEEIENRDSLWEIVNSKEAQLEASLDAVDLQMRSPIIPKRKPGKPPKPVAFCPHCQSRITEFEKLGWWWGWAQGIEPGYWEALRMAVFRRDDFICQQCHRKFGMSGLVCHHRIPKEDGGTDSARNLLTICKECHPDARPMFTDEEETR